jgi:hypothetical protein
LSLLSLKIFLVSVVIPVFFIANIDYGFLIVGVLRRLAFILEIGEAGDRALSLARSLVREACDTGRDAL